MKTIDAVVENKVFDLLTVLDIDIAHIQQSLLRLEDLRAMVVKRDNDMLCNLLGSIEAGTDSYRENESRRKQICQQLAVAFGLESESVKLSDIENNLDGTLRDEFNIKRTKLDRLAKKLKKEHFAVTMLIADCARVNRMLLDSIFNNDGTREISYGPAGAAKRENDINFVNMKL